MEAVEFRTDCPDMLTVLYRASSSVCPDVVEGAGRECWRHTWNHGSYFEMCQVSWRDVDCGHLQKARVMKSFVSSERMRCAHVRQTTLPVLSLQQELAVLLVFVQHGYMAVG